jgi:hypothetical protein
VIKEVLAQGGMRKLGKIAGQSQATIELEPGDSPK